jgi:hypothetical protein
LLRSGGDSYKSRASGSLHAWWVHGFPQCHAWGEGLALLLPIPAPLSEDHKVQVNTLYIRWDGVTVPGADRTGYALRKRKSGTVTTYDEQTPEKKD